MAEEQKEPKQVMKELQQVTTKNQKKVEVGKRLAESNHRRRKAKKREEQAKLERTGVNQYYGTGVVITLGVTGGLGYSISQSKKGGWGEEQLSNSQQNNPKAHL